MKQTDHPKFNAFMEAYKQRHPGDTEEQMMDGWARFRFNEEFQKYHSGAKK
jgi:hypothetical protein